MTSRRICELSGGTAGLPGTEGVNRPFMLGSGVTDKQCYVLAGRGLLYKGGEATTRSRGPDRREEPAVVGARRAGEPPRRRRRRARRGGRGRPVGGVEEPALRPVASW